MGTMIRLERLGETLDLRSRAEGSTLGSALPELAVRATLPLARTVSRFDAGFAVPAWRDAGLTFAEATLDTLVPVEFTVTRIMLIPCPNRSRYSLLAGMVGCNIAIRRNPSTHLAIGSDGSLR